MISPCSACGVTLEHDHDPRTVLCGGCEADARTAARKNAPPPPPIPPPMRTVKPSGGAFTPPIFFAIIMAAGFMAGWIARGGL